MLAIFNPGTHPEPFHIAAAAARLQTDYRYVTASMVASDSGIWHLVDRLPRITQSTLEGRRLPVDISRSRVIHLASGWETAFQVGSRMNRSLGDRLLRHRNIKFMQRSVHVAEAFPIDCLIAQQTVAAPIFHGSSNGAIRILNYPIAHHRWSQDYLAREAIENPDWVPFLQGFGRRETAMRDLDSEVELADFILVASNFARRSFLESGVPESKLLVCSLGTSLPTSAPIREPFTGIRKLRILFAGQVNQRKGISYLLDAFRLLNTEMFEVRFVGPISQAVRSRIAKFPATSVIGPVTQQALVEHYLWADMLVLPSLIEGFGLTALDGMAYGTVPLVSSHTFATDVVRPGHNGFVVPPRDPISIAEAIGTVLNSPALLELMRRACVSDAQRHSWAAYGDSVLSILQDLPLN